MSDQATIVFDSNPAQNANVWVNTLDSTSPTSQVLPLPSGELCQNFNLQCSGTDIGSGIGSYTIYVSDNGGQFNTRLSSTIGHTYGFYSIATDLVGNMEPPKKPSRTNSGTE